MYRTSLKLIATAMLGLGAMPVATAADLPVKAVRAPAALVVSNIWAGFYIGGHCGGAWGRTVAHTIDDEDVFDSTLKPSGWLCGGQAGYNWQSGGFVLGAEGDLGYLGLKKTDILPSDDENTVSRLVKYGWYGTATGRLGYAWDQWLLYLKGGYAVARIRHAGFETGSGENVYDVSATRSGYTVGGGLEYAVSPNWSWKVEYLYMDFGRRTTVTSDPEVTVENRDDVHTVKVGLNYRFRL